MLENIPVNGTMAKDKSIQVEMTGVKDLRYYIIGVKMDTFFLLFPSKLVLLLELVPRLERLK